MGIPKIYRNLPEVNLASYDFYDLATGTGYKNFYLADVYVPGTDTKAYIITTQTIYSAAGFTSFYQAAGDVDFDLSINVPLTIEGDLIFSLLYNCSSLDSVHPLLTFNLYKVSSGGVETQIGTSVIKTTNQGEVLMFSGKLTCPLTRIQAGEKIRVNITTGNPGNTTYYAIYHDPAGRANLGSPLSSGATLPTSSRINLPIKL